MPVDSKVGRSHWGWHILLVTFWKFQHFNLVSKIFQKLFKPLPCHKSIGKMLHAICISAVAVSLRWASCGPWASCYFSQKTGFHWRQFACNVSNQIFYQFVLCWTSPESGKGWRSYTILISCCDSTGKTLHGIYRIAVTDARGSSSHGPWTSCICSL